jgi:hypothetical protein
MRLVDRAKNICLNPKSEWDAIAAESSRPGEIIQGYVLPLAAIAAVAAFIGASFIGLNMGMFGTYRVPIGWGLLLAVYQVVTSAVFVAALALIVSALAPTFRGEPGFPQALKLVAYAYTPAWIAGIVAIIPMLGILALVGLIYAIYLLYLGLPRLMKNPPEKTAVYTVVVVISAVVLLLVFGGIGSLILAPVMPAGPGVPVPQGG